MNIKITNSNGRYTIYTPRELAREARALIRMNDNGGRYLGHLVEVINGTVRLMVSYVKRDGTTAEISEVL